MRKVGEVKLHEGATPLEGEALIRAAEDCDIIVSYRGREQGRRARRAGERRLRNVGGRNGVRLPHRPLARGITASTIEYRTGHVPPARMGKELKGSTVGVIGCGAIGKEVVRVAKAFGMRVLINDPYQKVEQASLDQLLAESDYVVPLAVATAETENLIDGIALAKMKRGACLVNVSRGNLVDERALEAALDSGHLGGCAMDVGRAPDQMPTARLAARHDVIATPHAAEIVKGKAPKGAVNAEHWTRKK